MKKILSIVSIFMLSLFWVKPAFAVESPGFPSCSSPSGTVKVSYPSGDHAIVGQGQIVSGSDTVYDVEGGNTLQCYCADNGSGIQTNWWKITSLSQDEIEQLKNLGWFFVPDGSVWGLSEGPYMAVNAGYSCRGGGGGSTNGSSDSNNNNSNNGTGGSSGSVLGASTSNGDVLGLASTGDSIIIYTMATIGLSSLSIGFFLRKKEAK